MLRIFWSALFLFNFSHTKYILIAQNKILCNERKLFNRLNIVFLMFDPNDRIISIILYFIFRNVTAWRPQAGFSPRGRVTGSFQKFAGPPANLWWGLRCNFAGPRFTYLRFVEYIWPYLSWLKALGFDWKELYVSLNFSTQVSWIKKQIYRTNFVNRKFWGKKNTLN